MYKQFQDERYLYWSVMSAILQVRRLHEVSAYDAEVDVRQTIVQRLKIFAKFSSNLHTG
jgi:hypothetical protein